MFRFNCVPKIISKVFFKLAFFEIFEILRFTTPYYVIIVNLFYEILILGLKYFGQFYFSIFLTVFIPYPLIVAISLIILVSFF